jgi:hypothetical protein
MIGTKKGQAGAAVLVALLAILIILYVLFLPPPERAALLGEPGTGGPGTPGVTNVLFSSPVGAVYLAGMPGSDHSLPSLVVRTVEAGSILASADQVTAANNVFEKQPATVLFNAEPALARNAVLSFNLASRTGGNIIVSHNGNTIFNQDVRSRSVQPITLQLNQAANNITFHASTVGFAFWKTNRYTLSDVKVTADVTDVSAAHARQTFAIGSQEHVTLEAAQLSFVAVCEREGTLQILLNGAELFTGVPDCGVLNTLEIAPTKLNPGENTISFATRDGDFIIDVPSVRTKGKEQQNRVFRFTIDAAAVQGKQVSLRVMFADANEHAGTIKINSNTIPLRAQDIVSVPITQYIRAGENTIQFEATSKEFEVVKFDVLRS